MDKNQTGLCMNTGLKLKKMGLHRQVQQNPRSLIKFPNFHELQMLMYLLKIWFPLYYVENST